METIRKIGMVLMALLLSATVSAKDLKVLQINIWQEGTQVKGGFEGLVDVIQQLEPDVVMMSEVRNYKGVQFVPCLVKALRSRGCMYYGETSKLDVGIISKYKIIEQGPNCAYAPDAGSVLKAKIAVGNQIVVVYSAHLDYTHYACYLPRGYDGVTWQKLKAPIVDKARIERANRESKRDEAIGHVIEDARREEGHFILLGGDFNEPSHLDWSEEVKDLWDHRGAIVNWDCSVMLQKAGFIDSYREKYPNVKTHPGFTYAADNPNATMKQLDWVPDADGRDRIDYIYYVPVKGVRLKRVRLVGPSGSIVRNQRVEEDTKDKFIEPSCVWPSDHKGVLAVFKIPD